MTTIHPPLGAQEIDSTELLDTQVLAGAQVYLHVAGPVPISELVRVLAQHLETGSLGLVNQSVRRLAVAGKLHHQSTVVSLPAGGDARDTEEHHADASRG